MLCLMRSLPCLILSPLFRWMRIRIFCLMRRPLQIIRILCLVVLVSFLLPAPAVCQSSVPHSSEFAVALSSLFCPIR